MHLTHPSLGKNSSKGPWRGYVGSLHNDCVFCVVLFSSLLQCFVVCLFVCLFVSLVLFVFLFAVCFFAHDACKFRLVAKHRYWATTVDGTSYKFWNIVAHGLLLHWTLSGFLSYTALVTMHTLKLDKRYAVLYVKGWDTKIFRWKNWCWKDWFATKSAIRRHWTQDARNWMRLHFWAARETGRGSGGPKQSALEFFDPKKRHTLWAGSVVYCCFCLVVSRCRWGYFTFLLRKLWKFRPQHKLKHLHKWDIRLFSNNLHLGFKYSWTLHPGKLTAGYPKWWAVEKGGDSGLNYGHLFGINSVDFWGVLSLGCLGGNCLDVSKSSGTPQIIHLNRVFHYKPSILGYPYFRKHPVCLGFLVLVPVFVTFQPPLICRWNTKQGFMMNILTSWNTTSASLVPLFGVVENGRESGKPPEQMWQNDVCFFPCLKRWKCLNRHEKIMKWEGFTWF